MAGSVVQYDGFLASGAAALTPSFGYVGPSFSFGAQGTWVTFESGNDVVEARAAGAWLRPGTGWRAEVSGAIGLASYTGTEGTGHIMTRFRLHRRTQRSGIWGGLATGLSGAAAPVEMSFGMWQVQNQTGIVGDITLTSFGGAQYVDVNGGLRWTSRRMQVDLLAGARPISSVVTNEAGDPTTTAWGEVTAWYDINNRITALISAGISPGDPIRNQLGASSLSIGLRLKLFNPPPSILPVFATAVERSVRAIRESSDGSDAVLDIDGSGATALIRVVAPSAQSVEIMADFTDWNPVSLTRISSGEWELSIAIAPGAHRLNIRVDGGPWVVPIGTRLEQDEFGGAAGVIVIR